MAPINEKDRAMTLARFKILQVATSKLPPKYSPQIASQLPGNLLQQYTSVKYSLTLYNKAQAPYKKAAIKRKLAFAPVSKILTRVRGEVKTIALAQAEKAEVVKAVEAINRGYRGIASPQTIAKAKAKAAGKTADMPDDELDTISVAQTSFVERPITSLCSWPIFR